MIRRVNPQLKVDMRLLSFFAIGMMVVVGCGRKNPVAEVSVSQSGVEIVEPSEPVAAGDWPLWRGPTTNGIAPDQPLVTQWDASTNVRWRSDVPGRGHSSPIVVGDTVYLATAIDNQQKQMVLAYNRADGTEKWQTVVHSGGFPSDRDVHKKGTNANGTIACNGTLLFTAFLNSDAITATALDLKGDIVWQKEIGKFVSKFGYAPSPVLYKSLVIFAADNYGGGYLTGLDAASGEIAWRVARTDDSSYSSPAVANVGGRDQLLISGGGAVTSYDPATGDQLWQTPCIAEATCGTVVTTDDKIFASGGYPERETVCLSSEGKKIWSDKTKVYEPSMIVSGENLVAVNDEGIAFCWAADSGDLKWKKRLGGNVSASPLLCNGTIYVSNLEGDTFVFVASDQYEPVSKNRLGDDCYASPAAAGGELFLRIGVQQNGKRSEQLVCLAAADDQADR